MAVPCMITRSTQSVNTTFKSAFSLSDYESRREGAKLATDMAKYWFFAGTDPRIGVAAFGILHSESSLSAMPSKPEPSALAQRLQRAFGASARKAAEAHLHAGRPIYGTQDGAIVKIETIEEYRSILKK